MGMYRKLAVCLALLVAMSPTLFAAGPIVTLPFPGVKPKSGLILQIDCRGIDANGYRPVRIQVRPISGTPLPADRQLRLVVQPNSHGLQTAPSVTKIIDLPEGSTAVDATLDIPQSGLWYSMNVEVYEDGDKLEDLSQPYIGWPATNYWDWTEARPTVLAIDSDTPAPAQRDSLISTFKFQGSDNSPTYNLPDIRNLIWVFPDPNRNVPGGITIGGGTPQISDANLLSQLADTPRTSLIPPEELPSRWLELSQFDMAIISLADLQILAKQHPERLQALSDWAATGPMLIVYGVGTSFENLTSVESALKMPPLPPGDNDYRGWIPADPQRHTEELISAREDILDSYEQATRAQPMFGPNYYPQQARPYTNISGTETVLPSPPTPPFVVRDFRLGKVVAYAAEQPFPGEPNDWKWLFNHVPRNHWMWYQRNGFSLHRTNDDYWTFLIPGVGEAPVISFLLLVSLFAVLIGPINYMFLGRARRLYLLLLTVPLGAVVVTLGLFSYALLTDGIGVRLRARSFTDLDQRSGRAVSWSRQSYYASLAPSRGLVFPDDATVFPIIHEPGRLRGSGPQTRMTWDEEEQHLQSGYIFSRTAAQFMVLRAGESKEKLAVREGRAKGQPPQVTNQLATHIKYLLLRDKYGDHWSAENLKPDDATNLKPADLKKAGDQLLALYKENPPDFPRGYDPNMHNNAISLLMPSYGWMNVDTASSQPAMASSLLESNLATSTRPGTHELGRKTYVAVTRSSAAVPYGVERVREEASLHIIRGRY